MSEQYNKQALTCNIVTCFINLVLLACAVKATIHHQNDSAINYIFLFLFFNICVSYVRAYLIRKS